MFLQKQRVTSPGSRNRKLFKSNWFSYTKHKKLTYTPKSGAGRGNTGQIVLWSKTSRTVKSRKFKINYNFRSSFIGFIATFVIVPFQNKLLALIFFNSGYTSYMPTTTLHKIFMFTYFTKTTSQSRRIFNAPTFFSLNQIKRTSIVSLLELLPGLGIQYCRSSGCKAKLTSTDFFKSTAFVTLPSGIKKIFSLYSIASKGQVSLPFKKYFNNTKAGYWRSWGCKSMVRGVARNPVDHPHGGRTKSIKYPRTPWGKTTKYK